MSIDYCIIVSKIFVLNNVCLITIVFSSPENTVLHPQLISLTLSGDSAVRSDLQHYNMSMHPGPPYKNFTSSTN